MGWLLVSIFNGSEAISPSALAYIYELEGEALILREGQQMAAKMGLEIYKFDRILTPANSNITLNFITEDRAHFGENSEVLIKMWDNTSNSLPIYATVRRGVGRIVKAGKKDQLVIENSSTILTSLTATPMSIRTVRGDNSGMNTNGIDPTSFDTNKQETTPISPKKSLMTGASTMLSNQDISATVFSYLKALQKCQLNAYNFQQQATGQLTVKFSILPMGKTEDISIQSDTNESDQMAICIKSVFERIRFPQFEGNTIAVNYPLRFE